MLKIIFRNTTALKINRKIFVAVGRCGTIARFLHVRFPLIYSEVRSNWLCSREFRGADFEFAICFSAWVSIFCWYELKMLQKLAERLNDEGFESGTSIALCKNFCFVCAVTYFCFECNNFVRKSMYVV